MARASGIRRGIGQVMVGDDEVEAERGRFGFGEGAHAGIDADDEADAVGCGGSSTEDCMP
jgi:hypothetical protein